METDRDGIKFERLAGALKVPASQQGNNMHTLSNNAESYTPTEDVTETLEDGRQIQVAVKGVPMPVAEAEKLGLIKGETKSETPTANKSAAPTENKAKK